MDPNHHAMLRAIRRAVRDYKQAVVNEYGIGTDIPHLLVLTQGRRLVTTTMLDTADHTTEAGASVTVALSDADLAVVTAECYVSEIGQRGDLRTAFAGGDPQVQEAVTYVAIPKRSPTLVFTETYRYRGKTVEWVPIDWDPGTAETEGEVVRSIRVGFRAQENRPGPALITPGSRLFSLGHSHPTPDTVMLDFALALPCPCGSARPINRCCAMNN